MAPKKQPPRNAFFFYMLSVEKELKKNGKCTGGMKGLAEAASPGWQLMSAAEKKVFEEMASAEKGGTKYTSQGQTYEEVEAENRAVQVKEALMLKTIRTTLVNLGRNTGLAHHPFFFVHINYFCKTGDGVYFPAEIGFAAFSIKNGVTTPYDTIIDPGPLPTGHAYNAQQIAQETHQIDYNKHLGEKHMNRIVVAMDEYIEKYWPDSQGEMPPVYTLAKFIPSVEQVLVGWAAAYNKPEGYYRVFPVEELFFQLKNFSLKPLNERRLIDGKPDEGFVFSSMAAKILGDDPFSHRPHTACPYHEDLDVVQYCSRSYVIRWAWVMSNHLCDNYDIAMVPGQHCPRDTLLNSLAGKMASLKMTPPAEPYHGLPAAPRAAGRGQLLPSSRNPANPWQTVGRAASSSGGSVAGAEGGQFSDDSFADNDEDVRLVASRSRQKPSDPFRMPKSTPAAMGRGKLLLEGTSASQPRRQRHPDGSYK